MENSQTVRVIKNTDFNDKSDLNEMDHQGIKWKELGYQCRETYRQRREMDYTPHRDNISVEMPKFPKQNQMNNKQLHYQYFYKDLQIKITHFQLRYCLQAITPYDIVFVTNGGLGLFNINQQKCIKQELQFGIETTMINFADNMLVLAGLQGDVQIVDARNFKHLKYFKITDEGNHITNYAGFMTSSALKPQSQIQQQEDIQLYNQQNMQSNSNFYIEQINELNNEDLYYQKYFQKLNQMQKRKKSSCNDTTAIQQEALNLKSSLLSNLDVKLVTACNDHYLKIFDLEKCQQICKTKFSTPPNIVAYNQYKQIIATQCDQLETELLDPRSLKNIMNLKGHKDFGFSMDWNPNWNEIATGNQDGTVRIFDIRTGKCLKVLQGQVAHTCCVKYTDQHLIVGEGIDYVHLFDYQREYEQQTVDFFGELNGISVFQDKLFFGVHISDYQGIFEYKIDTNLDQLYNKDIYQQTQFNQCKYEINSEQIYNEDELFL